MRFTMKLAALTTLCLMAAVIAAPTDLTERQSTIRIMALGDSITGSPVRLP